VKVAYDGRKFHGSQIQPGLRTVEGDFLSAAEELGIMKSREGFSRASRTDAGVSALGNVFVFDSEFSEEAIPSALNSRLRDIRVRGIAAVSEDFNPRWAKERRYRYYLPYPSGFDVDTAIGAASLFSGEHDFSSYTKDRSRNPVVEIKGIEAKAARLLIDYEDVSGEEREILRFLQIDISADHFLWNMVRWIVGAIEAAGTGKIDTAVIEESLSGKPLPPSVKLARPDFLVLLDVEYGGHPVFSDVGAEDAAICRPERLLHFIWC